MVRSRFTNGLTVLFICVGLFSNESFARNVSEPDHEVVPEWLVIKDLMFGERNIRSGEGVISLYLNTKLDDVSTVPVMVNANLDQTEEKYIQAIYLVVDRNPIPTAGKFRFTPQSGRVKLETRLRFEKFSFVRAVAELNTGLSEIEKLTSADMTSASSNATSILSMNLASCPGSRSEASADSFGCLIWTWTKFGWFA